MDLELGGKKVLITGGTKGIGEAIATQFLAEGADALIVGRDKDQLAQFAEQSPNAHAIEFDLQDLSQFDNLIDKVEQHFVPDIIIHNVGGTLGVNDPLAGYEDWQKVFDLNLFSTIKLNEHFIPKLVKQQWGRIIHISSVASLENQGPPAYCAAKAALNAYVRSVGRWLSSNNIVMATVSPGATMTTDGYWDQQQKHNPEHYNNFIQQRMAVKRMATPEEIANMVLFLSSEKSGFIAGSNFLMDGGQGKSFSSF